MATFVVGATTATFGAMIEGVSDRGGPIRELNISVHYVSEAEVNNLRSLLSYLVDVIPMPWGNTVEVLVKGGAGMGVLTIAGLGVFSASYLTEVERNRVVNIAGHSIGKAKFLVA